MAVQKNTKSYRVGTVGFATETGLGRLIKDFHDNGIIDDVLVWKHKVYKNHKEWYRNDIQNEKHLLEKIDVLLIFENVPDWKIIARARQQGILTVLVPMYEWTPRPPHYSPDLVLCVSDLDQKYWDKYSSARINVPVTAKWKKRRRARTFIHNAGHGGRGNRNGTDKLLQAIPHIKSPIKLIIRHQDGGLRCDDPRVTIVNESVPYEDLWKEGDVFVFPETYNGLSLPIQEAYASGLMVMCGARFPMTEWLPNEPMIPVHHYVETGLINSFQMAKYDPCDIAQTIDKWYDQDIEKYSLLGKKWGKENSWDALRQDYIDVLTP